MNKDKAFEIVTKLAAQGDLVVRRVEALPEDAVATVSNGRVVVAHSETGHDHAIDDADGVMLFTTPDPLVSYLKVSKPYADVVHHRPWDTHRTLRLYSDGGPEVIWEIRRQREWTPEGYRRVED